MAGQFSLSSETVLISRSSKSSQPCASMAVLYLSKAFWKEFSSFSPVFSDIS